MFALLFVGQGQREYHGRRWEYTETGKYYFQRPDHHRGFTFTVMTYNILAQDLLERHSNMYNGSWDILEWRYRRRKLLQEIKHHMPDVSQECLLLNHTASSANCLCNENKIFSYVYLIFCIIFFSPNFYHLSLTFQKKKKILD